MVGRNACERAFYVVSFLHDPLVFLHRNNATDLVLRDLESYGIFHTASAVPIGEVQDLVRGVLPETMPRLDRI
jgi:hypothetical protein